MTTRSGTQVPLKERPEEQVAAAPAPGVVMTSSTTAAVGTEVTGPSSGGLHFQTVASTACRPRHEVPPELAHIPKANVFPQRRYAWNSQQEIVSLLLSAADHEEWISKEVQMRPPNGSLILYRKPVSVLARGKDGYTWKKKLKRRTVRESHIFLKINGVECILANYAHSAILATFHRRTYFLCHNSDIVLFHYLNVPPLTPEDKLCIPLPTLTPADLEAIDKARLIDQLKPMFDTFPTRITRPDRREILYFDVPSVMRAIFEAVLSQKEGRSLPSVSPDACFVFSVCSTSAVQYVTPRSQPTAGSVLRIVQHRPSAPPMALLAQPRHAAAAATAAASKAWSPTSLIKVIDPPAQASSTLKNPSTYQLTSVSPPQHHLHKAADLVATSSPSTAAVSAAVETALGPVDVAPKLRSLLFAESPPAKSLEEALPTSSVGLPLGGPCGSSQDEALIELDSLVPPDAPTDVSGLFEAGSEAFSQEGGNLLYSFPSFQEEVAATASGRTAGTGEEAERQQGLNEMDFLPDLDLGDVIGSADQWSDDVLNELLEGEPCGESGEPYPCEPLMAVAQQLESHPAAEMHRQPTNSTPPLQQQHQQLGSSKEQATHTDRLSPVVDSAMDALVEIKHCAPDWAYAEGGCRMLLTGPWYSSRSPYSCIFDATEVPAVLVQTGVLACTVPKFAYTGEVRLRVACEGRIISMAHTFRVKEGPNHPGPALRLDVGTEGGSGGSGGASELTSTNAEQFGPSIPGHHAGYPPLVKTASADAAPECDARWFLQFSVAQLKLIIMDKMDFLEASLPPARFDEPVGEIDPSQAVCPEACADTLEWILCRSCQQWSATGQQTSGRAVTIQPGASNGAPTSSVSAPNAATALAAESSGLSLLHAAAGLGYTELIRVLLSWRRSAGPPVRLLQQDVDGLRLDGRACTPLMWACARGHAKTVEVLVHSSPDALRVNNSAGLLPVQVAEKMGHYDVVRTLSRLTCGVGASRLARSSSLDSPAACSASLPVGSATQSSIALHELMDLSFQSSTEEEEDLFGCVTSDEESSAQMVCLAGRIIQAMPRRIKLSPSPAAVAPVPAVTAVVAPPICSPSCASTEALASTNFSGANLGVVSGLRRNRSGSSQSSSYSSLNSDQGVLTLCGPPPPDDSGISTPFDEYRYAGSVGTGDVDTPSSSLSPGGCGGISGANGGTESLASPYTFSLDSPPPTTAEIAEHFNASATFMEKDFSRLTLSDQEQKRLYEAAKVIQNCYRQYKRKQRTEDDHALPECVAARAPGRVSEVRVESQREEPQKEIEAATIIQSYYRRYKQYAYYKRMCQAAVLIQNQFRSYVEHKRAGAGSGGGLSSRIKTNERFKRNKHSPVLVNQKFRNHYQRKGVVGAGHIVSQAVASSVPTTASLSCQPEVTKGSSASQPDPDPAKTGTAEKASAQAEPTGPAP